MMVGLIERYPQLTECPHRALGDFPTPVISAGGLADWLGAREVWIKCDDLSSSLYGGNKVRKLEFVLGDAITKGYRGVWTVGAIGSHHVLATALHAKSLGLKVKVAHFPQPITEHVLQNCLATAATGADCTLYSKWKLPFVVLRQKILSSLGPRRGTHYYIPGGGSSPAGCLGYVNGALELAGQVEGGELPRPDILYVAVGTAGTLVGLVIGFHLAKMPVDIVGVRVVDRILVNRLSIRRLIGRTVGLLRHFGVEMDDGFAEEGYRLDHRQFGQGYGHPTEACRDAVRIAKQEADLELEHTYTGKAMASLLNSRLAEDLSDKRILFWNTFSSRDVTTLIPEGFSADALPPAYAALFQER